MNPLPALSTHRESPDSGIPPFYVTGGSLRADAPSYIERSADSELLNALLAGEFCYVLTARQMGKSSLMVRTAARLRSGGGRVAVLDLTAIGQNLGPEQWYYGLLCRLGEQLHLEAELRSFWRAHKELGPLQRFMDALRSEALSESKSRLTIFIDEVDVVRSLPFATDELFAAIRECYHRRSQDSAFDRLTFCLLGVAAPTDLIRDTRMTPFNIGRRIELGDFTAEEALPLSQGLRNPKGCSTELLKRILYWTGGHPYLTQRLCLAVADSAPLPPIPGERIPPALGARGQVDRACQSLFLSHRAQERDDNLIFVRERMLRSEADLAALLDLYRSVWRGRNVVDDDSDPLVSILRLSGICRVERGRLHVRNPIYQRVFNSGWSLAHMPDAEIQRQRAAYRRGLLRAAAAAFVILSSMTGLTVWALVSANDANSARKLADTRATAFKRESDRATRESNKAKLESDRSRRLAASESRAKLRLAGALRSVTEERNRANREAERALGAERRERNEKLHAIAARTLALNKSAESRQRLARQYVSNGMRLADEGDPFGALPWLVEALRLERGDRSREQMHRVRIAAVLRHQPRLAQTWFHNGPVTSAEFTKDGKLVVTASEDGTARVWNAVSGEPVTPLLAHTGPVRHASFSPDGRRVATASDDASARIWSTDNGRPLSPPLRARGPVLRAKFSPDGGRVLTASGSKNQGEARIWNSTTGEPVTPPLEHAGQVNDASFSPDGLRVATACGSPGLAGEARIWDASTGLPLTPLRKYPGYVTRTQFSPDGLRVVNCRRAALPYWSVIDAHTGKDVTIPSFEDEIGGLNCISFSPDGIRVAGGCSSSVARVWDSRTGRAVSPHLNHGGNVLQIAFSPDGRSVATAGGDGTARVWDAVTGVPLKPMLRHGGAVTGIGFSPDGSKILTGSADGTARVWNLLPDPPLSVSTSTAGASERHISFSSDGERMLAFGRRVWNVATGQPITPDLGTKCTFSPDGQRVLGINWSGEAQVWDASNGRPVSPPLRHRHGINHVEFSADGFFAVTAANDHTAQIWDIATGRKTAPPIRHKAPVRFAAFSSDGKRVVTISDYFTRVWDSETGEPITPPLMHKGVAYAELSRDGRRLVTVANDGALIWDATTGRRMTPVLRLSGDASYAAFSPDGRRVVTTSWGGTAQVWDGFTGAPVTPPLRHKGGVNLAAFSRDGQFVATVGRDGGRVWDVATGEPITPLLKGDFPAVAFSPNGSRVAISGWGGFIRIWDIGPTRRPYSHLLQLAGLLSGERIDPRTGPLLVDSSAMRSAWSAFRGTHPEDLTSPATIRAWEYRKTSGIAGTAERNRDWSKAIVHINFLLQRFPKDSASWARRGFARAELGQWIQAADDYALAIQDGAPNHAWYMRALTRLGQVDIPQYRKASADMLARFRDSEDQWDCFWTVWANILTPESEADTTALVVLAEKSLRANANEPRFLQSSGAALYRAGRYQEAIAPLNRASGMQLPSESSPAYGRFFLAMAHARLRKATEARKWLEEASKLADSELNAQTVPPWNRRLTLQLLRREAESVVNGKAP